MRRWWSLPGPLLVAAVLYAAATVAVVLMLATERPWLGLRLAFDREVAGAVVVRAEGPAAEIPVGAVLTTVSAEGRSLRLEARDFIVEPDGVVETYGRYDDFLERQDELAGMQAAAEVVFTDTEGREWRVAPGESRPVATLPATFWVQVAVGVVAWLIAAGVWVFRRGEASARYLLLSGWSTVVFAPLPAVYSTRELGLPGELFRWLSDLNFMGGSLFAGTMVALLLTYPRRVGPAWLGVAAVAVQAGWFAAQQVGVFESMILARRVLVMVALAATFGLSWWQWRLTRRDPVGRAALRWFLLSWVVCSGVFGLLILLPQMFGFDTTGVQAYSFLLFLLVYVGLGFGILRYRLFGLDEWWARIITWMAAVALLVVLDLLFLLQLQLSSGLSLSLSLLICGVLWLPLRGWLAERFLGRKAGDGRDAFKAVVDVALAPRAEDRTALWGRCLRERFDALRVDPTDRVATAPELEEDGLALCLPAVGDVGAVRLRFARGGRALFSPRDVEAARGLIGMLAHVIESRHAYERGVRVERDRIARDIHDNIGAQLLSALHAREETRREETLRGALSDLRGIINDASNPSLDLEEALADLRHETADRVESAGLALRWEARDGRPDEAVPARVLHVLRPLIREAVSNVLKHARASRLTVEIRRESAAVTVVVEDDGAGFDPAAVRRGHGLDNLQARAASLGGSARWTAGAEGKGARAIFMLPLKFTDKES